MTPEEIKTFLKRGRDGYFTSNIKELCEITEEYIFEKKNIRINIASPTTQIAILLINSMSHVALKYFANKYKTEE